MLRLILPAILVLMFCVARPIADAQPEPGSAQAYMNKLSFRLAFPETRAQAADDVQEIANALRSINYNLALHLQRDPNPVVRQKMASAIAAIGPTATNAIPFVIKALDDRDEDVRIAAIKAVGGTAPASKAAVPKLIKFVQDKNPIVRRRAIGALTMMGQEAREAVPVLIGALNDPDEGNPGKEAKVAFYAVQALAAIGADAKAAGQALLELQGTTKPELRGPSLEALAKIVPDEPRLVPIFVECLRDNHGRVRLSAAYALARLGPKAKDAVPALIDALRAPYTGDQFDVSIKSGCARALGQIGADAVAAVPILRELSSHMDPTVREEAKSAIEKIHGSK
jgi:HEAT repeat protein